MDASKTLDRKSTSGEPDFPSSSSIEDIVAQIHTQEAVLNPDHKLIHTSILRKGRQAHKIAILFEIISRKTGEFKQYNLDIHSFQKFKKGWYDTYTTKFTFTGNNGEIEALYNFLGDIFNLNIPKETGNYYKLSEEEFINYQKYKKALDDPIQDIIENPDDYYKLLERGGEKLLSDLLKIATLNGENITPIKNIISSIEHLGIDKRHEIFELIHQQNLSKEDINILTGRKKGCVLFEKKSQ